MISSDNSAVYINGFGAVSKIDTATDSIALASDDPGSGLGDFDLAISSDQSTIEATSFLYDANLNAESYLVLNDRDVNYTSYVYGAKLSPDGSLLFQPATNGIDVYDGRFGTLRMRVSLPVALSQNFDALVSDGKDNILIAITGQTGTGIAVVDLSAIPEPTPLPYGREGSGLESGALWGNDNSARAAGTRPLTAIAGQKQPTRRVIEHVTNGVPLVSH